MEMHVTFKLLFTLQFFSSRVAEVEDLKEETHRMLVTGGYRTWLRNSFALISQILKIDDLVSLCDLFGPFLAVAALSDWALALDTDSEGRSRKAVPSRSQAAELEVELDAPVPPADLPGSEARLACLAGSLLLLGIRILRLLLMSVSMGPLVMTVNSMIEDVARWLVVQLTLLIGYTSALYALADVPSVTTDEDPSTCELLTLRKNGAMMMFGGDGAIGVWFYFFGHMIENFLVGDADLDCMRFNSTHPTFSVLMMMSFQLLSAVMMVNMLIAMMAKTVRFLTAQTQPCLASPKD